MFSYEIEEDDGVVVLTCIGEATVDDYQSVAPMFFADVKTHGIRKALVDAREFAGWDTAEAESLSFQTQLQNRNLIDRVALVAHDGIKIATDRLSELFSNAGKEVRAFQPTQFEAARAWLKEDSASDD